MRELYRQRHEYGVTQTHEALFRKKVYLASTEAAETKYRFASCRLTCRTQFSQNSRLGSREVLRIQNLNSEDILARDMKKNNNNQL